MRSCSAVHTRLASGLLLCILVAGCETGPTSGTRGKVVVREGDTTVAVVFSDQDRKIISDYYGGKRRYLPPGLDKQVRRSGELPPGLQREMLPPDLERRLSRLPDGYVRIIVGTDIVAQDNRTSVVVDVIKDIAI